MSLRRTLLSPYCFLPIGLLLTSVIVGCGSNALSKGVSDPSSSTLSGISGSTYGGQQPVVGATVQFYSAGATGYGSAARPLVGCTGVADGDGVPTAPCSGVTTIAGGSFTITTPIVCPPNSYVYATATGGNPGGPIGSKDNAALVLMTGLGSCSGIPSQTYIEINEVTTAASVAALQQFMSATYGTALAESVGAPSTNLTGLANAFATIPQLVNTVDGSAISTSSKTSLVNGTSVQLYWEAQNEKLNNLGNILSTCVNSNDIAGSGGDPDTISAACTTLFSTAQPSGQTNAPADTVQAMLDIAQNPTNIGPYTLKPSSPPFSPALSSAPNDWQLTLSYYSAGATKFPVSTGTSQDFFGDAYGLAVDTLGNVWVMNIYGNGSTSEIGPGGVPLAQVLNGATSSLLPRGIAIDTNDNIWVADFIASPPVGTTALSEYVKSSGAVNAYSYPSGYGSAYGLTIDGSNNVFVSPQSGGSLLEVPAGTASGTTMTAFPFAFTHSSTNIAVDHNSNLWLPYPGGLEELEATCSGTPVSCTYSATNTKAYGASNPAVLAGNFGGALDSSGDMWMGGEDPDGTITKFAPGNAAAVVSAANSAGGLALPQYVVVDGGNNIWTADNAAPGSATSNTGYQVSELSNSGTAISGTNGYWINMQSAGTPLVDGPRGIAIDGSGNVWVSNALGKPDTDGTYFTVSEIVGAAVPAVTPVALAVKNNTVGQKP
jgi:hypothetical protein